MTLHHFIYLPLIFIMMSSLACESTEESQEVDMEIPRQPRPRPVYKDDPWFEKAVVEGGGVGLHTQLEVSPNGKVGVAYWSTDGVEGEPCSGLDVDDPPLEVRWGLHYAQWSDETGWEPELVSQPLLLGIPPGLDLDYQRTGRPVIAALAGDPVPEIKYCGGSDLGLFTPSTNSNAEEWDVSWVVTDSDQAMSGEAASDFGYVVGYWPSIAKSSSGARMAVYQDVHAGSLQRDDLSRADLEVAFQDSEGSSWSYEVIDLGEGAGIYNRAVYAEDDSPVVLYYISIEAAQQERVRQGIWVARRVNGEWRRALVFGGPTKGTPSMIAYQGGVAIAYYDPQIRHPVIARLKNLNELESRGAWERTSLGDLRYNEGQSPSLALTKSGRLSLLWYRCGPAESEECRPADDAVIFSWQREDESWALEVVESGEEGLCGFSPSLTIGRDGRAWAAWRCSRRAGGAGEFEYRLESAQRDPFDESAEEIAEEMGGQTPEEQ